MSKFSRLDDEKLIRYMKGHPYMYTGSRDKLNQLMRMKGWFDIAKKLKNSEEECKTRWRTIKICYQRQLKTGKSPSYDLSFLPVKYTSTGHASWLRNIKAVVSRSTINEEIDFSETISTLSTSARKNEKNCPNAGRNIGSSSSQNQSHNIDTDNTETKLNHHSELMKLAAKQASDRKKGMSLNIDLRSNVNEYQMRNSSKFFDFFSTPATRIRSNTLDSPLQDDSSSSSDYSSSITIGESAKAFPPSSTKTGETFSQKQCLNNHVNDTYPSQHSELMNSASMRHNSSELHTQLKFDVRSTAHSTECTPGASMSTPSTSTNTLSNQTQNNDFDKDKNTLDSFFEVIKSEIIILPRSLIDEAKEEISKIVKKYLATHNLYEELSIKLN